MKIYDTLSKESKILDKKKLLNGICVVQLYMTMHI